MKMAMDGQKETKQPGKTAEPPKTVVKRPKRGVEVKNELPPKWSPDKDGEPQEIEGYYRGIRRLKSGEKEFDTYQIEQIDEDGEPDMISFAGGIADRLMARVPRDTYVFIKYLGKIKAAKGKAKNFEVVMEDGVEPLPEIL